MKKIVLLSSIFMFIITSFAFGNQSKANASNVLQLNSNWMLLSSEGLNDSGEQISQTNYSPKGWMPAVVPGTVLTSYVANKIYPDPYFDISNRITLNIIPDANVKGSKFTFAHWYRTSFDLNSDFAKKQIWLNFNGTSWKSMVYLNGKYIGEIKGMFTRGMFNITDKAIVGKNSLAVKVVQLDHPGEPSLINICGGDLEIGLDAATMYQTVGWNFTFSDGVRDRNMGIHRNVFVSTTGPIQVRDPFVSTTSIEDAKASLSFKTYLINATNVLQKGILNLDIEGIKIAKAFSLNPNETKEIEITSDNEPKLIIANPRLWWPNGKGSQALYNLKVTCSLPDNSISDTKTTNFGIRTIEKSLFHGQSLFSVNGKRVFLVGGNWVQDAMLRTNPKRYEAEFKMLAQAGINYLRCWSGSGLEDEYFFKMCDKYGMLAQVESGLCSQVKFPLDSKMQNDNWKDIVLRVRNHPSVFLYVGCNEGEDIPGTREVAIENDGTREYTPSSQDDGQRGSPYRYQNINWLYDYSGVGTWGAGPLGIFAGFNNESGNPSFPQIECLKSQFDATTSFWPIDSVKLNYHDAQTGNYKALHLAVKGGGEYGSFDTPDLGGRVGAENYCFKAQIVSAMQYRAQAEIWKRNKFNDEDKFSTGYALWTVNNTHPKLDSRLYNYTLEPTASLFYFKRANTTPVHAQFDYYYNDITVVNDTYKNQSGLKVTAEIRNLDWSLVWSKTVNEVSVKSDLSTRGIFKLPTKDSTAFDDVYFIDVILRNNKGEVIDKEIYWRAKNDPLYGTQGSFKAMNNMAKVKLNMSSSLMTNNGNSKVIVKLENPTSNLAFFTRLKIYSKKSQKLLQPCFYSDNYFSLRPSEKKTVTLEYDPADLCGENPVLIMEGWNMDTVTYPLTVSGK